MMRQKNISVIAFISFLTNISSYPLNAECSMKSSFGIYGDIFITQENRDGPLSFTIALDGFDSQVPKHGIQVHEGSFDNGNCKFVGRPFVSSLKSNKEISDLGSIDVQNGSSRMSFVNDDLLLFGSNGIAGRTIAIHPVYDDKKDSRKLNRFWRMTEHKKQSQPIACCKILFAMAIVENKAATLKFHSILPNILVATVVAAGEIDVQ